MYQFKSQSKELKALKKELFDFHEFKKKFPNTLHENKKKDGLYCEYITLIGAYRGIITSDNKHLIFFSCIENKTWFLEYKYGVPVIKKIMSN